TTGQGHGRLAAQTTSVDPVAEGGTDGRANGHPRLKRVCALPRVKNIHVVEEDGPETLRGEVPPRSLCSLLHDLPHGADVVGASPGCDEPVAEFPGDPHRLWPKGSDVDWDRAVEVHNPPLWVEEPDRPHDITFAVRDRLAVQQPFHRLDIVP